MNRFAIVAAQEPARRVSEKSDPGLGKPLDGRRWYCGEGAA
jgi:hypothetical protein